MQKFIIVLISFVVLACGGGSKKSKPTPPPANRPGSGSPGASEIGKFYFDAKTGSCKNGKAHGRNIGKIGECGSIRDLDLSHKDYKNYNFNGALIENVKFDYAQLDGATFIDTTISDSSFDHASLQKASFKDARFYIINLPPNGDDTDITNTFKESDLRYADLRVSSMWANFKGADLRHAHISNSHLSYFNEADLRNAIFDYDRFAAYFYDGFGENKFIGAKFNNLTTFKHEVSLSKLINNEKMIYTNNDEIFANDGSVYYRKFQPEDSTFDFYQAKHLIPHRTGDYKIDDNTFALFGADLIGLYSLKEQKISNDHWLYKTTGASDFTKLIEFFNSRIKYIGLDLSTEAGVGAYNNSSVESRLEYLSNLSPLTLTFKELKLTRQVNGKDVLYTPFEGSMILAKDGTLFRSHFDRITTYLHEAHHSTCTTLPGDDGFEYCGNPHVKCPDDHELKGKYACDNHPWGSYTLSAAFSSYIANNCTNDLCTEYEKTLHRLLEKGSLSRILVLDRMKAGDFDHINAHKNLTIDEIDTKIPGFKKQFESLNN